MSITIARRWLEAAALGFAGLAIAGIARADEAAVVWTKEWGPSAWCLTASSNERTEVVPLRMIFATRTNNEGEEIAFVTVSLAGGTAPPDTRDLMITAIADDAEVQAKFGEAEAGGKRITTDDGEVTIVQPEAIDGFELVDGTGIFAIDAYYVRCD